MKILSVNAGSSSLKFQLYEMPEAKVLISGIFERIGINDGIYTIKQNGKKEEYQAELKDHSVAVDILLKTLLEKGVIKDLDEIKGVGHRLVHGGDKYNKSVIIDDDVMEQLRKLIPLAPLHNPANIMGVEAFQKAIPNALQVGCFDTAFHQTMAPQDYMFPVPYEWYEQYGVRKYGFYGTSHKYVTEEIRKILGRDNFKLISCHLGNGGSVSAIKDMKVVDTSTGFTPLSGIVMGTRSGDIDPSIIPFVMEKEGKNVGEIIDDLTNHSGLLGISEYSHDMRDILEQCDKGNEKAILAKNKFVRRVVDFISQYYVLLGGVDAIVFTAGIGENSVPIRREICERLACLGVKIDLDMNNKKCEEVKISTNDSSIAIYTIPTDEELMVAKDTLELITNR